MGFQDSSLFSKIAIGLGGFALLFDLIGLAAPYWLTSPNFNGFLFQQCQTFLGTGNTCFSIINASSDLAAAQAMNVIGFLAGLSAVVLIVLFVVLNKPVLRLVGMIASFVAAGFILIGVIIVGDFNSGFYDVGWAMVLAILGALLYIGTGVVLVVDLVKK